MVGRQGIDNSLNQRVSNYLHGEHIEYAREEFGEEALVEMFNLLLEAKEDLRAAQERIDLLNCEIAKIEL